MKKLIYCACAVALATACTDEDLAFEQVEAKKGITFEAAISQDVATRGAYEVENGVGHFFWFAEQDRINVYADNVNGTDVTPVADWTKAIAATNAALYKATKSQRNAYFTSTEDAQTLTFKDNKDVNFVAVYPQTTTITGAAYDGKNNVVTAIDLSVGASNVSQSVAFNEVAAPMYSIAKGKRNADYQSVGEQMALSFKRPFPVLAFSSASGNDQYNSVIGKLGSISVTTKGGKDVATSKIAMPAASNIAAASVTRSNKGVLALTSASATATVTLKTAANWASKDYVYMSILPAQRKQVAYDAKDATKKTDFKEDYTVTYNYANVTLTKNLSTANDWMTENATYAIEVLDIAKDFSYIVTNKQNDRTLMVFKGNFADVFAKSGKVNWNNGEIELSEFTQIISDVALTDKELATLKGFTELKTLTLNAQTSICGDVFDETLAENITTLNLPKVTAIEFEDNAPFEALKTLDVNSYKFEEDDVYTLFFNENVKVTLQTLKIEAIESLRPQFSYDRTIKFTDYTALKSVALNKTRVQLTTAAFQGCTSLATVTGIADITNAPSAFAQTTALKSINVYSEIIPNHAFEESGMKSVLYNKAQVAPTEIGESAFAGATAIVLMDLSKATLIGKNAFNGATAFTGTDEKVRNVVDITADVINDGILANTAVVRVQFVPATAKTLVLGTDIFGAGESLKQIKFTAPVDVTKTNNAFTNITSADIDLFVVLAQNGVYGNTWTYAYNTSKDFKSITREDGKWTMGE